MKKIILLLITSLFIIGCKVQTNQLVGWQYTIYCESCSKTSDDDDCTCNNDWDSMEFNCCETYYSQGADSSNYIMLWSKNYYGDSLHPDCGDCAWKEGFDATQPCYNSQEFACLAEQQQILAEQSGYSGCMHKWYREVSSSGFKNTVLAVICDICPSNMTKRVEYSGKYHYAYCDINECTTGTQREKICLDGHKINDADCVDFKWVDNGNLCCVNDAVKYCSSDDSLVEFKCVDNDWNKLNECPKPIPYGIIGGLGLALIGGIFWIVKKYKKK